MDKAAYNRCNGVQQLLLQEALDVKFVPVRVAQPNRKKQVAFFFIRGTSPMPYEEAIPNHRSEARPSFIFDLNNRTDTSMVLTSFTAKNLRG